MIASIALLSTLSIVFLASGLSNIFVYHDYNTPCAIEGTPSLDIWTYGSGIGYTVIGGFFLLSLILAIFFDSLIIALFTLIFGGAFAFAWTIVGTNVWLKYGFACSVINNQIFFIASATILTFFAVIPSTLIVLPYIIGNL